MLREKGLCRLCFFIIFVSKNLLVVFVTNYWNAGCYTNLLEIIGYSGDLLWLKPS